MNEPTYPFLLEFYARASDKMGPAVLEWVRSRARATAGGKAYPANAPLTEDTVVEGISDNGAYRRVYNACVKWAGKDLADKVARASIVEQTRDSQSMPYHDEVESDPVNDKDFEGLKEELGDAYDMTGALFMWGFVNVDRIQELYGPGAKAPPDYVPKEKRAKWVAMFNAILKSTGDESKAFAITNARYGK